MCCLSDTRRPQNLNKCVYMEKLIRRGRRTIHLFDIRTADLVEHGYDSRSVFARNSLEERDLEMDPDGHRPGHGLSYELRYGI